MSEILKEDSVISPEQAQELIGVIRGRIPNLRPDTILAKEVFRTLEKIKPDFRPEDYADQLKDTVILSGRASHDIENASITLEFMDDPTEAKILQTVSFRGEQLIYVYRFFFLNPSGGLVSRALLRGFGRGESERIVPEDLDLMVPQLAPQIKAELAQTGALTDGLAPMYVSDIGFANSILDKLSPETETTIL